jgi:hypothetical protein
VFRNSTKPLASSHSTTKNGQGVGEGELCLRFNIERLATGWIVSINSFEVDHGDIQASPQHILESSCELRYCTRILVEIVSSTVELVDVCF